MKWPVVLLRELCCDRRRVQEVLTGRQRLFDRSNEILGTYGKHRILGLYGTIKPMVHYGQNRNLAIKGQNQTLIWPKPCFLYNQIIGSLRSKPNSCSLLSKSNSGVLRSKQKFGFYGHTKPFYGRKHVFFVFYNL